MYKWVESEIIEKVGIKYRRVYIVHRVYNSTTSGKVKLVKETIRLIKEELLE